MQIVIVGCGNVGGSIARSLSKEGHDVTIVDNDIQEVKDLSVELDVMAIEGNGSTLLLRQRQSHPGGTPGHSCRRHGSSSR